MTKKVIVLIIIIFFASMILLNSGSKSFQQSKYATTTPTVQQTLQTFSYEGKNGVNALTILKEKTIIEQESSGLVSSINGRKADSKRREYWAFYVNGKMATVGPADYITKDTDRIEWKVEHY